MKRITLKYKLMTFGVLAAFMLPAIGDVSTVAAVDSTPGTVSTNTSRSLAWPLIASGTARKITYYSTSANNSPVLVSGVVLRPFNAPATNGKIVAWAHGTTGLADVCAPSNASNLRSANASNIVTDYLKKGWTVVATDYEGLGTPGDHPYGVGQSAARSVIDSVRAAKKMYPTQLGNDWVVSGHSQGGHASLWAGEIAGSYAPELNLKGVASMAPANHIEEMIVDKIGAPDQGFIPAGVYGLAAADSTVIPSEILAQPALDQSSVILSTGCINEIGAAYQNFTPSQLITNDILVNHQQKASALLAKFAAQNPGQQQITVPVGVVQGTDDVVMPYAKTSALVDDLCENGTTVTYAVYPGVGHSVDAASRTDAAAWISDRFANRTPVNTCS